MRAKIRLTFVTLIIFINIEPKKAYRISDEDSNDISLFEPKKGHRISDEDSGQPPDRDSKGMPLPYAGLDLTKQDTSELFNHYLKAAKIEDRVREIDLNEKTINELAETPFDSSELYRQYVEAEKNADHARVKHPVEEAMDDHIPVAHDSSELYQQYVQAVKAEDRARGMTENEEATETLSPSSSELFGEHLKPNENKNYDS